MDMIGLNKHALIELTKETEFIESFRPFFREKLQDIKPLFENEGFTSEEIQDGLESDKLELFTESLGAEFKRGAENVSLRCRYSKNGQIILSFSYHLMPKSIDFFITYYAIDQNLPFFINHPVIQSHEEGELYISKYFEELKKLLETALMDKINNGTIDNHYYRFHDQFR